ncbi:hypothetical protein [Maribacter sp.]|uniref:hypothetical protein n=1 Tax=Maribacter sp. TaxID=1897614 RepID=UPI0025BA4B87|nr:hypothetical protein [Maribacter sp.]
MQNTPKSFDDVVQSWESFLRGDSKRVLRIQNLDTNVWVVQKGKSKPSLFSLKDMTTTHSTIAKWVDAMIVEFGLKNIKVLFRKLSGGNGTATEPNYVDTTYNVTSRYELLTKHQNAQVVVQPEVVKTITPMDNQIPLHTAPIVSHAPMQQQQNFAPQQDFGLGAAAMRSVGGAANSALAAGMGLAEFIELKKNAERAEEYRTKARRLEDEVHSLTTRNRELESSAFLAKQELDLAIRSEQLNKKTWLDGDGAQKILELAPAFMQGMQSQQPQAGLAAPSNASPEKQKIIGYLEDEAITENMLPLIEQTIFLLAATPEYAQKLNQLNITEYATANGNG